MEDPNKASTEESNTGIELRVKPLNHLIEFQNEAIFAKNSLEVIADNENNFKPLSKVHPELFLNIQWKIQVEHSLKNPKLVLNSMKSL